MKFLHKLCYIALGGFLFALGTIISPIVAEKTKFGEIECTKLTVVNQDGDPAVVLNSVVDGDLNNGVIHVYGAIHGITGGKIFVHNGQEKDPAVFISASPDHTYVAVQVAEGDTSAWLVSDGVNGGRVSVNGKRGQITLNVDKHGGRLDVYNYYSGAYNNANPFAKQGQAFVGINKYGNGVVQTWKKNGEPFHSLSNPIVLPRAGKTLEVIESRINGTFNGWEGETVVKLMNGQIWKQSVYHYEYHYAYMPDVLIYKSGSGFKMLVDGTDEAVYVEQIK